MKMFFSFRWSHVESAEDEDAWRLTERGGQRGTAAHTYQWHWSPSRVWKNAETAICTFFIVVGNVCYVPTSSHLRTVLMSWAVFGMSGPFLCPSVLKRQQSRLGTKEKGLYCVKQQWSEKDPSPLPGPSSQGPLGAMFYQPWITMHHCSFFRDLTGSRHAELYSNVCSHFYVRLYMCGQILIFHHFVLSPFSNWGKYTVLSTALFCCKLFSEYSRLLIITWRKVLVGYLFDAVILSSTLKRNAIVTKLLP